MSNALVKVSAIIPAAGAGKRMGSGATSAVKAPFQRGGAQPKQFLELRGKPLLDWTIEAVSLSTRIDEVVLVVREVDVENLSGKYLANESFPKIRSVVAGGIRRTDSVEKGVSAAVNDWVMVHDAARPFVSARLIEITIDAALKHEAAAAALPVNDTVKEKSGAFLGGTVDRDSLLLVQTPQLFRKKILLSAFQSMKDSSENYTDETSLLKAAGHKVAWVAGERTNIKITTPDDLQLAEAITRHLAGGGA